MPRQKNLIKIIMYTFYNIILMHMNVVGKKR